MIRAESGERRLVASALLGAWAVLGCAGCAAAESDAGTPSIVGTPEFGEYWFAGKAELARYELEQARYGEIHRGDAVLIFVTEDFLPDKQVKADSGDRAKTGAVPVLKLNFTREFPTGIYPYSLMTSVFSPLDLTTRPHALKASTGVQEWCGHTYLQLNLRDGRYRVEGHSYFESEADESFVLAEAWLEDEIWTRIRLAPDTLPVGRLSIIPGTQQARLRHRRPAVERAVATLEDNGDERVYTLVYAEGGRRLAIRFENAFPHGILGWEDTYRSGFGPRAKELTTRARRTHVLQLDYWTKNATTDRPLRRKLGL